MNGPRLPGAVQMPVRDLGGLPVVYVLGRGSGRAARVLHVGQTHEVGRRQAEHAAAWRAGGRALAEWCTVWAVAERAITRTEAAVQAWLQPAYDTPRVDRLRPWHLDWLLRLGLTRAEVSAWHRRSWHARWRERRDADVQALLSRGMGAAAERARARRPAYPGMPS